MKVNLLKFIGVSVAQTLSEGSVLLPNLIFAGLIYQHYRQMDYLMPFVLLYTFEKAGMFFLHGWGRINNPYTILMVGLMVATGGSICTVFGKIEPGLWEIGAILIGVGLSAYTPMYLTLRDKMISNESWGLKNEIISGYAGLLLLILLIFGVRHTAIQWAFVTFFTLLVSVTAFVWTLRKRQPYGKNPPFQSGTFSASNIVLGIVAFLLTLFIRVYKQTSDIRYIVVMFLSYFLLFAVSEFQRKKPYRIHSLRTMWYGSIRNFVTIFSLIFFTAVGRASNVTVAYIMIGFGVAAATVCANKLQRLCVRYDYEKVCVAVVCGSLLLLIVPIDAVYMVGVFLTCMFVACGNRAATKVYLSDIRFRTEDVRLVRAKFYGMGAVFQQGIMLLVLAGANVPKEDVLGAYSFASGSAEWITVYRITLVVCIIIAIFTGVLVARTSSHSDY